MNKIQSALLLLGGVLMVVGAVSFAVLRFACPGLLLYTCWMFLAGTVLFALMQAMQFYEGGSQVTHRLKRMQTIADIFLVFSGISMVDTVYAFFRHWFANQETYITCFYNKWVVFLLVAAVLELYTTLRISAELKKEQEARKG